MDVRNPVNTGSPGYVEKNPGFRGILVDIIMTYSFANYPRSNKRRYNNK